ncbi:MAG: hypothetical protein ACI978_002178 [Oleispira sp.]|jgi:hypothetical protein
MIQALNKTLVNVPAGLGRFQESLPNKVDAYLNQKVGKHAKNTQF